MKSARGSTKHWEANVYDGALTPSDPEELSLTVYDPNNSVVNTFPVFLPQMTRLSQGHYQYDWPIPPTADLGTYRGEWNGLLNGGAVEGHEDIEVVEQGFVEVPGLLESVGSYMTPLRLKTMALGTDFSRLSPFELQSLCLDSTVMVNAYCNQPLLPVPGSFLGGHAVDEQHSWRFPATSYDRGTRRVYPNHWPIIDVEKLAIVVGHGAETLIPPDSLVINNDGRWVEVTALTIATPSGLFGTTGWVVPFGGLQVPISKLSYRYGWSLPVVNELVYPVDPTGLIFQPSHGWWTDDVVSVSVAGTVADPSSYSIDRMEGRITFTTAPVGYVQVSYTHRLPYEIARAAGYVCADLQADADIRRRGLQGLASLRVNEIEMRRPIQRTANAYNSDPDLSTVSPRAAMLLNGFRYWSAA